jgi:hypothetical protein
MTTHRRYSYEHPRVIETGHDVVQRILDRACSLYWWYQDPVVEGRPFNRLLFSFTVSGRDQWWVHHRAQMLAQDCYYAMGMTELAVPQPVWESLAPHMNRGRWRTPAAS